MKGTRPRYGREWFGCPDSVDSAGVRRRTVLRGAGAVAGVALAGCGEREATPDPVTLSGGCDVCGMIIEQRPGPNAQIFYADERPAGHDNPARFETTWEAFRFEFDREDWTRRAFYVTDYQRSVPGLRNADVVDPAPLAEPVGPVGLGGANRSGPGRCVP